MFNSPSIVQDIQSQMMEALILVNDDLTNPGEEHISRTMSDFPELCTTEDYSLLLKHIVPAHAKSKHRLIQEWNKQLSKTAISNLAVHGLFYTILHKEIAYRNIFSTVGNSLLPYIFTILNHLKQSDRPQEVEKIINQTDLHNKTPLLLAIMSGNYDIADTLLDLGADPNIQIINPICSQINPFDKLCSIIINRYYTCIQAIDGLTALHAAYIMGQPALIKKLIDRGANENAKDGLGRIASDYANLPNEEHQKIAHDISVISDACSNTYIFDKSGFPLMNRFSQFQSLQEKFFQAIFEANIKEVKEILPFIDINTQDEKSGNTAMHLVCICESPYWQQRFNIQEQNITEEFINNRKEICRLLLEHNPDLSIQNKPGRDVLATLKKNLSSTNPQKKKLANALESIITRYQLQNQSTNIDNVQSVEANIGKLDLSS